MPRRKAAPESDTSKTEKPDSPESADSAKQSVGSEDSSKAPAAETKEAPPTADKKDSPESQRKSTSDTVKVRYDGIASRIRIAGYQFRPGQTLEIKQSELDEFLTVPFERFTKVKE